MEKKLEVLRSQVNPTTGVKIPVCAELFIGHTSFQSPRLQTDNEYHFHIGKAQHFIDNFWGNQKEECKCKSKVAKILKFLATTPFLKFPSEIKLDCKTCIFIWDLRNMKSTNLIRYRLYINKYSSNGHSSRIWVKWYLPCWRQNILIRSYQKIITLSSNHKLPHKIFESRYTNKLYQARKRANSKAEIAHVDLS